MTVSVTPNPHFPNEIALLIVHKCSHGFLAKMRYNESINVCD
jgi:hypothetical protein